MKTNLESGPLALAKQRITIPELGARFFPAWRPGKSCSSPFREDKHPSFSVFDDGRAFKDHATGEHGDAADFVAKARGLSKADACRELIRLAGTGASALAHARIAPPRPAEAPSCPPAGADRPALPADLAAPTAAELDALARLRHLPDARGLVAAAAAGHLFTGTLADRRPTGWERVRCWILTDSARRGAQARTMDGEKLHDYEGNETKAKTLPGFSGKWPVGCADIGDRPRVLVAEGGPDFLCLWHLIVATGNTDCAPVGMLGAGQSIHPEAAPLFRGKDVTIYPHADAAGLRGRDAWARQLYAAGAKAVRSFNLAARLKGRGKDLNNLVALDSAESPAPDGLCPACWSRRIAAPMGGPTCTCTAFTWPVFTADQLANDFRR